MTAITDWLVLLCTTLAGVFYAHFLVSKKEQRKSFDDLKEKFVQLDQTAIREAQARLLIHDAIQPLMSTLNELKGSMDRVEKGLTNIELQRAYDKGVADAISKGQT